MDDLKNYTGDIMLLVERLDPHINAIEEAFAEGANIGMWTLREEMVLTWLSVA
jgi:hypothetical protein